MSSKWFCCTSRTDEELRKRGDGLFIAHILSCTPCLFAIHCPRQALVICRHALVLQALEAKSLDKLMATQTFPSLRIWQPAMHQRMGEHHTFPRVQPLRQLAAVMQACMYVTPYCKPKSTNFWVKFFHTSLNLAELQPISK